MYIKFNACLLLLSQINANGFPEFSSTNQTQFNVSVYMVNTIVVKLG